MKQTDSFLRNALKAAAPWLVLGSVIPALVGVNMAFVALFPAGQPLLPLPQSAFVYQTRDPNKMFGTFYYSLGTRMAVNGQLLAAEAMLAKAATLLTDDPYVYQNYASVLESLEKYPEAMAQYQKAVTLDPEMVQPWYRLGLLYDRLGDTDKGIEILHKAVALDPDDEFINYDLGVLYAKKGDFANSAVYSKKAILPGSEFAEAYNNYGYALAHLKRYDEALEAINRSLELKPDSAATLDSRGFIYYGMGRYEDALADYMAALQFDPTIGEIYLHLAEVHERLKDYDKAVKAYETYLQLTPEAGDRRQVEQKIRQLKQWNRSARQ